MSGELLSPVPEIMYMGDQTPDACPLFLPDGRRLRPVLDDSNNIIEGLLIAEPPTSPTLEQLRAWTLPLDQDNRVIINVNHSR